jgi:hypothetical protein
MRRIVKLVIAAGLSLGLATVAGAQTSMIPGGMPGAGGTFSGVPQGYGYNAAAGGMNGYYPTGSGVGFSGAGSGIYPAGYHSAAYPGFVPVVGYNPYLPYPTAIRPEALSPTSSAYTTAYAGLIPNIGPSSGVSNPTTVPAPAYGASYPADPSSVVAYGYRRGLFGGLRYRPWGW